MINLSVDEILTSLDLTLVEEAILGNPAILLAHEFEDAKLMVWEACRKWLLTDLNTLYSTSLGLEEEFLITLGSYPVKGFLDLRGEYKTGQDKGKVVIADWKTTSGELDLTWQGRLVDSKQWKLYSIVPPMADYISYRGVSSKGKTREVYIKVPAGIYPDVEEYFGEIGDQMRALAGRTRWPQNMPGACGQFGQTCPFIDDCRNGSSPRYDISIESIVLSYSGAQRFQACNEKYRRIKHATAGIDGSDSTRLGNSVHSGLEEVYRQAFLKYGN